MAKDLVAFIKLPRFYSSKNHYWLNILQTYYHRLSLGMGAYRYGITINNPSLTHQIKFGLYSMLLYNTFMKSLLFCIILLSLVGCGSNSAPTLASISNQTTNEDTAKTVTLSGTDNQGSSLTYTAISSTANVTIGVSGTTLTLTPAANWNGSATITAKANDGTVDSSAQTFTLTVSPVNDLPSIESLPIFSFTKENTATTLTLVGTDVDSGDTLTYSATSSTSNVVPSLSGAVLTLTPATNFVGNAAITVKVNDGTGDSSTQTSNLAITELSIPLLIVKIQFNTAPFNQFQSSDSTWASAIFGNGSGQLNEYINEISNERFQFHSAAETDGTVNDGIVTASLAMSHPGNSAFTANDQAVIKAAITAIDSKVNFAAYDTNSNGAIKYDELQIMFLVAGGETATGHADAGSVWAHKSAISTGPTHDGVSLMKAGNCCEGNYSAFGERQGGNARSYDSTIGVIAHELGHSAFLLPDLYDYDSSSAGIGSFGLMGGGCWGYKPGDSNQGQTPTHMTALMKIRSGFVTPTVISSDGTYTANDINSSSHNIFKIQSGTSGEYFLLQNRNAVGYDQGLNYLAGSGTYAGGLLITHNSDNVSRNTNDSHRVVDIEEANNAQPSYGSKGHYNGLFYNGNSTTFNDSSTPNSKRVSGAASNIAITNIGNQGTAISFTVDVP